MLGGDCRNDYEHLQMNVEAFVPETVARCGPALSKAGSVLRRFSPLAGLQPAIVASLRVERKRATAEIAEQLRRQPDLVV